MHSLSHINLYPFRRLNAREHIRSTVGNSSSGKTIGSVEIKGGAKLMVNQTIDQVSHVFNALPWHGAQPMNCSAGLSGFTPFSDHKEGHGERWRDFPCKGTHTCGSGFRINDTASLQLHNRRGDRTRAVANFALTAWRDLLFLCLIFRHSFNFTSSRSLTKLFPSWTTFQVVFSKYFGSDRPSSGGRLRCTFRGTLFSTLYLSIYNF